MSSDLERREFSSFDGVALTYYDHGGDGNAALLLHGLLSRARDLDELADSLKAHGLRPIALDLRAHGDSGAPREPEAYRDQAMARDVVALGQYLGLSQYALAGYGLGAEVISRVVNLGAPVTRAVMCGWGGPPTKLLDLYASADWAAQTLRLAQGFEADDAALITDDMARAWRDAADRRGLDRFALAARQRSGDSAEPGLDPRGIAIPVLVICGAEDASPHEFAAALPNATGCIVSGGHTTAGRDPGLASAATDFLC